MRFDPLLLINWQDIVNKLQEQLDGIVPQLLNFLGALLVFFIGWMLARLLAWITGRFLRRIKIDDLASNLADFDMLGGKKLSIKPSRVLAKLVYYLVMLITLVVTVEILKIDTLSRLITDLLLYLPQLLAALVVALAGLWVSNLIRKLVQTAAQSIGIPSYKVIASVVFYFLVLNVLMIALEQAGIPTDFFNSNVSIILGGAVAAFALGYGIASRDMMANYLAGFYARDKFPVGSLIRLDQAEGMVIDKDASSLTLQTDTGTRIVLPMSQVTAQFVEVLQDNALEEEE